MFIGIGLGGDEAQRIYSVAEVAAGKAPRLGSVGWYDDPLEGSKAFLFIQASQTITDVGYICAVRGGNIAEMLDTGAAATMIGAQVGSAQAAMVVGEQGWIQVYGLANCRLATLAALGVQLVVTSTSGELDDAYTEGLERVNGIYNGETIGGADATSVLAQFSFPTVGDTIPAPVV